MKKPKDDDKIILQPRQPVTPRKDLLIPAIVPFIPKDGQYHLMEVGADGKEVYGSDFSVAVGTYETSFKNNPKFIVKKNP